MAQIVDWLGRGFDGVIVFDEAHAMANAAGEKSVHGAKKPSLQGQAGLRLQNAVPDARVVYVSATGATRVANLAYASRLGLWQTGDFPFASRTDFIAAMETGGIAAMEMVCRDLTVPLLLRPLRRPRDYSAASTNSRARRSFATVPNRRHIRAI